MDQIDDYDLDQMQRISEADPDIATDQMMEDVQSQYGKPMSKGRVVNMSDYMPDEELSVPTEYDIRGATSRPGNISTDEDLRNHPNRNRDEWREYREDSISLYTYQKMAVDPAIAFGMYMLKGWVAGLSYSIECPDPVVKGVVEKVYDHLHESLMRNTLDAVQNGFMFAEKVWKRDKMKVTDVNDEGEEEIIFDGRVANVKKLKYIDPKLPIQYWKSKETDELVKVAQYQGFEKVEVPREQLLWFALDKQYSKIFGRSRFKNVYRPWHLSKVSEKWMMNDLKRRGAPHLEIRYPKGSSRVNGEQVPNSKLAMKMAQNLTGEGVATLPSETGDNGEYRWTIEYADTKQQGENGPFMEHQEYSRKRKMMGMGIPPGILESNYSTTDASNDMLVVVVEDLVSQIEDAVDRDVIEDIVEYNFGPEYKSMVDYKIDKNALGRRGMLKEIFKLLLRTGSSMEGRTLKKWPDASAMMSELGIAQAAEGDVFMEAEGADRRDGETPIDEKERDDESNDVEDGRRGEKDDRDRDRKRDTSTEN